MHYYQFNVSDYMSHTSYLSPIEDLAYRRLLDFYYLHEKPIENNIELIAKKIGLGSEVLAVEFILKTFFKLKNDEWHQERVKKELKKYHSKAGTARANGQKGGRPKKKPSNNPEGTQSVILANPEETGLKAKQEPINIKHKPITIKQSSAAAMPCKDGEYYLQNDLLNTFEQTYKNIDVVRELDKARAWLLSNPNKQKTKRGCSKFLNGWLARAKPEPLNNKTHEKDFIELHTCDDWSKDL